MTLKKLSVIALVLTLVAGLTAGCRPTPAEEVKPINLIVAQGADAITLDPHKINDLPSAVIKKQIYDTLLYQDEKMQLHPALATEWRAVDDVTWEFKLRRDVKFHNGEILKASDVKFTFDRMLDPATKAPTAFILGQIAKTDVVDDYTVRITLKQPFAPILMHLAHTAASILNEKAVKAAGEDDYGRQPVGTGPFKFVEWVTGQHIDLVRYDECWKGKAKADTIRYRAIPEAATRAIELETGAVDIVPLDPADFFRLKGDPNLQIIRFPMLTTNYIGFNFAKPPYDNLKVRQAINHAINVDEIIEHVLLNVGQKATAPISPAVFAFHPGLKGYEFNPTKAKQLLTEAGYPNGFTTSIWTNENPIRMKIAEVVQKRLGDIGITVKIEVLEWGTYLADTAAGKHDMFILGWVTVTGDPDYGLYALFHSSQFGSAGNRTFYHSPRVDELLDKGRRATSMDERVVFYREAQEIIVADAPWLFLNIGEGTFGLAKSVTGFVPHPAGHHYLFNVSK